MLPKELLRYKIDGEMIYPAYITRKRSQFYLQLVNNLIEIYNEHLGKTRRELDDRLLEFEGERLNYKIVRGLANILDKQLITESAEDKDYEGFRDRFFTVVEKHRPIVRRTDLLHEVSKNSILAEIASDINPQKIQLHLYGDLKAQQILKGWDTKLSAEDLLRRYNLQLAQGILYRAESMVIDLKDNYKQVFRYLKLSQLMHRIKPLDIGYRIKVDGPMSLFSRTIKYGVHLAKFLPGLLLADNWEMRATIRIKRDIKYFYLNQDCGLLSYYRSGDPFDSAVEQSFYKKFSKKAPEWDINREADIINLGDTVFIPDFTLTSPEGKKYLLEIIGFWTPEYLVKKIEKVTAANLSNIVICVNENLNCTREDFTGEVIFYKSRINVDEVIDRINGAGMLVSGDR